jgi:hypothetical protein
MTKFIVPQTLATGDSFEDSRVKLTLVMAFDGETETNIVPLTEALAFDSAYEHYSAIYGSLDGREAVYYIQ